MDDDQYNLKAKSDAELHEWLAGHESTTPEYLAGIQELMERNDAPVNRREWIAMVIAIISIAVAIFAVIVTYE
ncbi:MAG: hypothetical protein KAT61_02200 [Gammaproteobacteria bacterium]|nr:hypothetical protein [Gammaproteobacteria bacterium]